MPGGLLALTAQGSQNLITNGQPDVTFFAKSFKRHSHFAREVITIRPEGNSIAEYETTSNFTFKIKRQGDLLSYSWIRFKLPAIYSTFYPRTSASPTVATPSFQFQWARQIGYRMIDRVELFVGGSRIDHMTGDEMQAYHQLDLDTDKKTTTRNLIGDAASLQDPANGPQTPSAGSYPHAVIPTVATETTAPSIPETYIHVPLALWFNRDLGSAIPLVALANHEVELRLTLRPIQDIQTILEVTGGSAGTRKKPTGTTQETIGNFLVPPAATSTVAPNEVNFEPTLQSEYVFLTQDEAIAIAGRMTDILIRQHDVVVHDSTRGGSLAREIYTANLLSRAVFFARRTDTLGTNDWTNLSNWVTATQAPHTYPTSYPSDPTAAGQQATAGTNTVRDENIIQELTFLLNGQEVQQPQIPAVYERLSLLANGNRGIGQTGLLQFSFASDNEKQSPSGSLNTSALKRLDFQMLLTDIPATATHTYKVYMLLERINIFRVHGGYGGLAYAQ